MILLDTNVLSELMRPVPDAVVLQWMAAQTDALYVTALSYAEILFGIDLLPNGKRRQRLGEQATAMFTEDFAGRILGFDLAIAPAYAAIVAKRQKAGKRLGPIDGMIAAIAKVYGAGIATRDGDFGGCGVPLINPWRPT
jgi:toxin FitB